MPAAFPPLTPSCCHALGSSQRSPPFLPAPLSPLGLPDTARPPKTLLPTSRASAVPSQGSRSQPPPDHPCTVISTHHWTHHLTPPQSPNLPFLLHSLPRVTLHQLPWPPSREPGAQLQAPPSRSPLFPEQEQANSGSPWLMESFFFPLLLFSELFLMNALCSRWFVCSVIMNRFHNGSLSQIGLCSSCSSQAPSPGPDFLPLDTPPPLHRRQTPLCKMQTSFLRSWKQDIPVGSSPPRYIQIPRGVCVLLGLISVSPLPAAAPGPRPEPALSKCSLMGWRGCLLTAGAGALGVCAVVPGRPAAAGAAGNLLEALVPGPRVPPTEWEAGASAL